LAFALISVLVTFGSQSTAATQDSWEEKDSAAAEGSDASGGADDEGSPAAPSQPDADPRADTEPGIGSPPPAPVNPGGDTEPGIGLEAQDAAEGPAQQPAGPPTNVSEGDQQIQQDAERAAAERPTREQIQEELKTQIRLGARGGSPNEGRGMSADEALDRMAKGTPVVPSNSTRFHEEVFANVLERLGREPSGKTPVAFTVGDGIRIDFDSLTEAQKQRFRELSRENARRGQR
jgi:hypothetical protein